MELDLVQNWSPGPSYKPRALGRRLVRPEGRAGTRARSAGFGPGSSVGAAGLRVPGWRCLCLRVEDPQGELLRRCLCLFFLSGRGIEFHCSVMELSLPGTKQGVSAGRWQVGRAASGWSRGAGKGKHCCPIFIQRDQRTPSEHVLPSAQVSQIEYV